MLKAARTWLSWCGSRGELGAGMQNPLPPLASLRRPKQRPGLTVHKRAPWEQLSIKGALGSIYGALFPGQTRLSVPFGMRNPAVPRSLASVGAEQGCPEAREVYLQWPRRETRCCSSLARSCSVQAAHHRDGKSLFVRVKWAEKSGTQC